MTTLSSFIKRKLSSTSSALCFTAASVLCSTAYAEDPTQPDELRHAVYSNKAAEIFWNRSTDDTLVVGYEVVVNDDVIGVLDATSYYSNSYVAGTEYEVSVTAIDSEGNRSETATLSFTAGDRLSQPPVVLPPILQPPSNDLGPDSPTNVRASIYSRSTFELFWDRPDSGAFAYQVFIDSVFSETTFGTSSMQRNLDSGITYNVEVVAVDLMGNASAAASTSVQMPGEVVVVTPPILTPPAPENALLAIYSRRSAELFWERAPALANIVNNEIKRDGILLGETNGVSFFDNTRTIGENHVYEIVAINTEDVRSDATFVDNTGTIDTGSTDSGTTDTGSTDSGTTDTGSTDSGTTDTGSTDSGTTDTGSTDSGTTDSGTTDSGSTAFVPDETDIVDVDSFYDEDGYDTVDVIRIDVRTVTTPGVCTVDDDSGCTLDDVLADIDGDDDFTVDIPIHVQGADLPDDGSISNAELRQRGGSSRLFPQKSFRIKLDSKEVLWRNERRLQLNKHPNERARIRNKLSFDLMRELPHLPSLRTQFVNLWIDDGDGPEDYGLFTHVEFFGKEYLVNRDLDDDDRVYKIEYFEFSQGDLDNIQVDENGEPLDEDRFNSRLDIKRGDDHSLVVEMLTAFQDPEQSFETVFDKYFNRNNVLTWFTANMLLYQTDAITHNFYLYNPVGSEKLYFLPWDYDGTFHPDSVLTNSYDSDALAKRLYYGYARAANSEFTAQFLKMPGIHEEILAVADELRNTYLTDSNITERAERYAQVVDPFLSRSPDLDHNPRYNINGTRDFANYVASIHEAMRTSYDIPMPHTLNEPTVSESTVEFSWTPAFDVTRKNELSYDLEVSSTSNFDADDIVLNVVGIEDNEDLVTHSVDTDELPSGVLYYRVTARGDSNPIDVWQVATNTLNTDDGTAFGVLEFEVP